MKCDYVALENCVDELSRLFTLINQNYSSIESAYKNILNLSIWDSITRDYFNGEWNEMLDNIDIVINKLLNIKNHLNTIVDNYRTLELSMSQSFGG